MRKPFFCAFFVAAIVMCFGVGADAQTSRRSVSAGEVTGTFNHGFAGKKLKDITSRIDILALGKGKLKVVFDLVYPYTLQDENGEVSANLGELSGEASIKGDTAVLESAEFGPCKITIKFVRPGQVKVTQDGTDANCGFGHNVTAAGTYKKVSSKKPTFDDVQ